MCFRSVCNYCPNLDQVPNVILDQIPQKELDQSTVDPSVLTLQARPWCPISMQTLVTAQKDGHCHSGLFNF